MKYFWLFEGETEILFSYIAQAMVEVLIMPSDLLRKFIRIGLLFVFWSIRIGTLLVFDVRLGFTEVAVFMVIFIFIFWAASLFKGK